MSPRVRSEQSLLFLLLTTGVVCALVLYSHGREYSVREEVGPGHGETGYRFILDLNTVEASDLVLLPGIGEKLAVRIVANRVGTGPYHQVDDLMAVKGIGPAKLAAIRPFVAVRDPTTSFSTSSSRLRRYSSDETE
ncbi:MAG: helix-hairpin-helix domain-containing protein [Planctomycetia bacterium]|nr:helix-hairpin-helix domain-containing protein [Planctomycetia bacterium]